MLADALSLELSERTQLLHHQLAFVGSHVEPLSQGPESDAPRLQVLYDLQEMDQRSAQALQTVTTRVSPTRTTFRARANSGLSRLAPDS
jgi:hypothetical protein